MHEQELKASCTHQRVVYRPTGGNSIGWTDRWVCDQCGKEFVPEAHLRHLRETASGVIDALSYDRHGIKAGHRYTRPDGSHVRVDSVGKGQVYFVSWKPGQEQGCPMRMLITDFEIAIRNERMILEEPTKLPVSDKDNSPNRR